MGLTQEWEPDSASTEVTVTEEGAGGMVKSCRGGHRVCREDVHTKGHRTGRESRPRAREGEEEGWGNLSDRGQWILFSFGSQGNLDEEPNMQMTVKAEVGGAEQEGFQRPVLVGGGRGVVDAGLPGAEQKTGGASSGLWFCSAAMSPNYVVSTVIVPSRRATGSCLLTQQELAQPAEL